MARGLLSLLCAVLALLPQGDARITICVADLVAAPCEESAFDTCCAPTDCCAPEIEPEPVADDEPTLGASLPCGCCIELEVDAPCDHSTAVKPCAPGVASPPQPHVLEVAAARPAASPSRSVALAVAIGARPPPAFALRI